MVAVVINDVFVGDMLQLTEGLSTIRQSHDKLCTQLMTDIHTMTADNQLGKGHTLYNDFSTIYLLSVQYKCISIRDYHYHYSCITIEMIENCWIVD